MYIIVLLKDDIEEKHNDINKDIDESPTDSRQNEGNSNNKDIGSVDKQENNEQIENQPNVENYMESGKDESPEPSHFMTYFVFMTILTVCGYLIFYNKKKVRNIKSAAINDFIFLAILVGVKRHA